MSRLNDILTQLAELEKLDEVSRVQIIEALSQHDDPEMRARCLDIAADARIPVPHVCLRLLDDPVDYVRCSALESATSKGEENLAAKVVQIMRFDPDQITRSWAAYAVRNVCIKDDIPLLETLVDIVEGYDHEDCHIKYRLAHSIRILKEPEVKPPPLLREFFLYFSPQNMHKARQYLLSLDTQVARKEILNLANDAYPQVRAYSVVFANDYFPKELGGLGSKLINDEDANVRWQACGAILHSRNAAAIEPLVNLVENDPFDYVRNTAVITLGEIGDLSAIPVLERAYQKEEGFDHEGTPIREWIAQAIEKIKERYSEGNLSDSERRTS